MPAQTRIERGLTSQLRRAKTPRGAAIVIATVSTAITLGSGLLMTIIDRHEFPDLGTAMWWAVQTVTTVGYGDHVPTTSGGQILAAVVMLFGIGFITVITASITSSFVMGSRTADSVTESALAAEHLKTIAERLERIEAALERR